MGEEAAVKSGMKEVTLHIYDVTNSGNDKTNNTIMQINKIFKDGIGIGGIFHSAVQVYGDEEWSFGYCEQGTGVFHCPSTKNPMYTFRESIKLGQTTYSISKVNQILREMSREWPGDSYDLLAKNCNHFCDELCERLGVAKLPVTEEDVGSVGRAFLNMKVESSPDLRLYSIQEFPLRNQAARTGLRRYLAMPVFDLLKKECYGVAETFSLLDHGLKEAGLRSTHFHSSPINFFNGSKYVLANGAHQPESEIVKMTESAMEAVPQLHTVQVWSPCKQCVTTTNTLTCLERTAFINFMDKKLNSCNIWEDSIMLNFLEACEFHHLQIEE